ncbi:MAG: hypothetical protein AB7F36_11680 [Reyranellaceae bacterium]
MPFDSAVQVKAVVLLVPDIADPVTHRRTEALKEAGCRVVVTGFCRGRFLNSDPPDGPIIAFGRTVDACYRHRFWALALALLRMMKVRDRLRSAAAIYARNLDQLALALAIRTLLRSRAKIFYEVLDIQPMASGSGLGSLLTRALERGALRWVDMLIVSSPAFHSEYFKRRLNYRGRWFLLENKLPRSVQSIAPRVRTVDRWRENRGDRWIVGYFGFIRGQATFDLIVRLARRLSHKVIFRFAGVLTSVDPLSFRRAVDENDNIEFVGGYLNPVDLRSLHAEVDLVWAIDLENTDGNSQWLMPCRFYEAGYFGVPCLAAREFEIGRTIAELECGWTFALPCEREIVEFFETRTPAEYRTKLNNLAAMPDSSFVYGPAADGLGLLVRGDLSCSRVTFSDGG